MAAVACRLAMQLTSFRTRFRSSHSEIHAPSIRFVNVHGRFRRTTPLEEIQEFHLQDVIKFDLPFSQHPPPSAVRSEPHPALPTTRFLIHTPLFTAPTHHVRLFHHPLPIPRTRTKEVVSCACIPGWLRSVGTSRTSRAVLRCGVRMAFNLHK